MENWLIFIGENVKKQSWMIHRKPNFSDAVILSHPSSVKTQNSPYQSIPLSATKDNAYLFKNSIQLTFHEHSLEVCSVDTLMLSEKEAFQCFNSFVVKKGNKVYFLELFPRGKAILNRRKKYRNHGGRKGTVEEEK